MEPTDETEVWFRNPTHYIRECAEVGVRNIIWDHGILIKKHIDPVKFMQLNRYPGDWRVLVVSELAAPLLSEEFPMKNPIAAFPVWKYGEPTDDLIRLIEYPVSERNNYSKNWLSEFKPRYDQEHRIICTYLPKANLPSGRDFYRWLESVQMDYPEVKLHIHGLYGYATAFGLTYGAVDIEPRSRAAKKAITMPNGKRIYIDETEKLKQFQHWIELLGFSLKDIEVPRQRCMFNIKSALWAGRHFRENVRFKRTEFGELDLNTMRVNVPKVLENDRIFLKNVKPLSGDKFLCNPCSLQASCKFFRSGAVCAVPGSEPIDLANFFKTRDSQSIMNGMQTLLQMEAQRITEARQAETEKEMISKEVTNMIDKLYGHAEKLAKLVDPALRTAPTASAALPAGSTTNNIAILGSSPQELASAVVNLLLTQGVPEDQITEQMVMELIQAPGDLEQKAIEAAAVIRAVE